jgi:molecular chaperone GrpE
VALIEVLRKEGLELVAESGSAFDPERHEAVMHEQGDGLEPVVAEVMRAGYVWNGRVLRPAMVRVKG